jgi:hypothetical protein
LPNAFAKFPLGILEHALDVLVSAH